MDKKIIGAVIVSVAVVAVMAGCVEEPTPEPTPTPKITPTPTPKATPSEITPTPARTPVAAAAVGCDMCHKTEATAELTAHVEGEKSCMGSEIGPCHTAEKYGGDEANVHTIHPSEAVGCAGCHGKIPTIPPDGPGGTSCEECHGTPNPLEPSEGRLVEIHLDRGRACTVCHTGEISEIHGLK